MYGNMVGSYQYQEAFYFILFYSILFYSILIYSIALYCIVFYSTRFQKREIKTWNLIIPPQGTHFVLLWFTSAYPPACQPAWEFTTVPIFEFAATEKRIFFHMTVKLHVTFRISYVYDLITKLCWANGVKGKSRSFQNPGFRLTKSMSRTWHEGLNAGSKQKSYEVTRMRIFAKCRKQSHFQGEAVHIKYMKLELVGCQLYDAIKHLNCRFSKGLLRYGMICCTRLRLKEDAYVVCILCIVNNTKRCL